VDEGVGQIKLPPTTSPQKDSSMADPNKHSASSSTMRGVTVDPAVAEVHHEDKSTKKSDLAILDAGCTESDVIADLPLAQGKRVLRKIDYRLVPLLAVLYLVAFIDRSNIGNARIAGLTKDLNLAGLQYNTAVTLFFPPYCLFEVPSNIVLKIIRPSIWLSILLFSWGITTVCSLDLG
jgi:hypothetical protein